MTATQTAAGVWARRRAAVQCALELGEELGEDGVSMRAIAKRLGCNQALLYMWFDDKRKLVFELEREANARLERFLRDAVALHLSPRDRLVALCLGYAAFASAHPWLYRLAYAQARVALDVREQWHEHAFMVRAAVLLDRLDAARDPVLLAQQLCVAMHGLATTLGESDVEPMFVERYVDTLVSALVITPR